MAFYDLSKTQREQLVATIQQHIVADIQKGTYKNVLRYFADDDTYIRKTAYNSIGKIHTQQAALTGNILHLLQSLLPHTDFKVRQTVINAAGEIGKKDFDLVAAFFDTGLFDTHPSPRNAVIGSIKKMGEVNPVPVLQWAKKYLHHPDKEIRREICHGIELRGRKHPADILPLLQELQFDATARVRNTLVHVMGQIAYKKDCLATVITHLKTWENKQLLTEAIAEIIDVHESYKDFAVLTQAQAIQYIDANI